MQHPGWQIGWLTAPPLPFQRSCTPGSVPLCAHLSLSPKDVHRRLSPVFSPALPFARRSQRLVLAVISITGASRPLTPVVEPAQRCRLVRKERKIESLPSRTRLDVVAGQAEPCALANDGYLVRTVPGIFLRVRQGADTSVQMERLRRASVYQDAGAHIFQACPKNRAEEGLRLHARLLVYQLRSQVSLFQAYQVP